MVQQSKLIVANPIKIQKNRMIHFLSIINTKRMISENGKRSILMSVHVHHGLTDGFHVGQFVDCFQELMNG